MKNIFLCRHGETEFNLKKIVQGHIDTDLTPKGIIQARLVAEKLKDFNIQKIYSSDLKRAYQTATIIADILNLDVEIDKRIREMHFGEYEGKPHSQIDKNIFQNWLENPVKNPLPKQEDIYSFEKRLRDFLEDIINIEEENILVVGHGGSIHGFICIAYGFSFEKLWRFRHNNTGITLLQHINGNLNIKFINYSEHLDNLGG